MESLREVVCFCRGKAAGRAEPNQRDMVRRKGAESREGLLVTASTRVGQFSKTELCIIVEIV